MFSELKTDLKTPRQRIADGEARLSPVQPRSTLLTVLFFSAVALAIAYWIFFPPAAPINAGDRPRPDRPEFHGRFIKKRTSTSPGVIAAPSISGATSGQALAAASASTS